MIDVVRLFDRNFQKFKSGVNIPYINILTSLLVILLCSNK